MLQVVDAAGLAERSMIMLPRLDVEAAAGAGAVVASEQVSEMVAFSAAWLRERHITPRSARILTARGDSMEPTIRDGDLLVVDTAIEMAVDAGIYILAYDGVLLVKRLFIKINGDLIISSDNKLVGRDEEVPADRRHDLQILGRVMWFGRTI
ncbi:MAG: S24 family peptidase [Pseudomonadota bacterium]|nr:S24 family peptidase [Pseudomonadota bacterium]